METIKLDDATSVSTLTRRLADVILYGGLVCLPCNGTYRIVADLTNPTSVLELMQSKSRTGSAPALIFIHDQDEMQRVAAEPHPLARKLAQRLWPRPLTIRVQLHPELPRKIVRHLGGKKAKVGIRVPDDELARELVRAVGRPLLVSSANRQRKHGASSPAQVRKTFGARIDVFVDGGDLQKTAVSTVVDIVNDALSVVRKGAIDQATLQAVIDS